MSKKYYKIVIVIICAMLAVGLVAWLVLSDRSSINGPQGDIDFDNTEEILENELERFNDTFDNDTTNGSSESTCQPFSESTFGDCYSERTDNILNVIFVEYGNHMSTIEFDSAVNTTVERFGFATNDNMEIKVVDRLSFSLPDENELFVGLKHDYSTVLEEYPWLNQEQAKSIWYYENSTPTVSAIEIYEKIRENDTSLLNQTDIVVAFTRQQFEGLGIADKRMLLVNQPSYGGWGLGPIDDNRYTVSNYGLADEAIHEIGHFLGLEHPGPTDFTGEQGISICEGSSYVNDVMSYCRDRTAVDADTYYTFLDCNLKHIVDVGIPALKSGLEPPLQKAACQ